jgi:hypothetical protein
MFGDPVGANPTFPGYVGARKLELDAPRTYHLANWGRISEPQRIAFLRKVAVSSGRDPRIRELAWSILSSAGIEQRQYRRQAAAMLSWVQANIQYVNEPGEILQDPLYTLKKRAGDCDDMAILLASLYEAVALPWRYVLSGIQNGRKVRWVEGTQLPWGVKWAHIYVVVGWPPFRPRTWSFAEPTIKGATLGWDVIAGSQSALPEMGSSLGAAASSGMSLLTEFTQEINWKQVALSSVLGVGTLVVAQLVLDWIRAKK